jgi:hypothetical protein
MISVTDKFTGITKSIAVEKTQDIIHGPFSGNQTVTLELPGTSAYAAYDMVVTSDFPDKNGNDVIMSCDFTHGLSPTTTEETGVLSNNNPSVTLNASCYDVGYPQQTNINPAN